MAMRQPPSPAVEPKNDTVRRTSSTAICWRNTPFSLSVRSRTRRSPCALGGDAARHRMVGVDGKRGRGCNLGRGRIGMGEHEAGHAVGERRLADALGPDDQKGMRHAAAAIGGQQCRFGAARGRTGPRSRADAALRLLLLRSACGAHAYGSRAKLVGVRDMLAPTAGSSLQFTTAQICLATSSLMRRLASITTQRSGSCRGESEVGIAQLFVKFRILGLEPIGRGFAAATCERAAMPTSTGRSRTKVRSGVKIADGNPLERL